MITFSNSRFSSTVQTCHTINLLQSHSALIPSQGEVHVGRGDGAGYTDHVLAHAWFLLRASCHTLEIKEFRCYEVEIESEKAGSHWELNPGHHWLEPPVLYHCMSHDSRTTTSPHNPLYVLQRWYCHTPGSHSVCAVRTLLWVDQTMHQEHVLSGSLNAQPHAGNN